MVFAQNGVAFFFVQDPIRFFADIDAIERGLADVDATGFDERAHVAVEKCEQKRRNVVAVAVGIGEQDDFVVAQVVERAIFAEGAPEGVCDVAELAVLEDFVRSGRFGVEDFAAQWQYGLNSTIAALFCRSAGRIAFDNK